MTSQQKHCPFCAYCRAESDSSGLLRCQVNDMYVNRRMTCEGFAPADNGSARR